MLDNVREDFNSGMDERRGKTKVSKSAAECLPVTERNFFILSCLIAILIFFVIISVASVVAYFFFSIALSEVMMLKLEFNSTINEVDNFTIFVLNIQEGQMDEFERFTLLDGILSADFNMTEIKIMEQERTTNNKISAIKKKVNTISLQVNENDQLIFELDKKILNDQQRKSRYIDLSQQAGHSFESCDIIKTFSPGSQSGVYSIRQPDGSTRLSTCRF